MRLVLVGLFLPLAACASVDPAPQVAAPATAVVANAAPGGPPGAPSTNSPNVTVQIADKAEPKTICWTETVTGTRGRKQKVCRTEGYDRSAKAARDSLKNIQDRSGAGGPPASMGGG